MLAQLRIKDFILIQEQEISLETGLNVLTGETGAGKSIVLQAIQILLGSKAKPDIVRPGSEEALVEGLFYLDNIPESIKAELPDLLQGEELLISRSIGLSGRSKIYVNGRLSSLQILETLRPRLVNICSQNQQVRLLEPRYHLEILDGYLNKPEAIEDYRETYRLYQSASAELKDLESSISGLSLKNSHYQEVVEELSAIQLAEGRREMLEAQLKKQQGAEKLTELCTLVSSELGSESQLLMAVRSIQQKVSDIAKIDPEIGSLLAGKLTEIKAVISDCEIEISRYQTRIDLNEESLEAVRSELAELARLMRKYKMDESQLAELLDEAISQLSNVLDSKGLEKKRSEVSELEKRVIKKSSEISELRKQAAKRLSSQVVEGLQDLNLKGARFEVNFEAKEPGIEGSDSLEFRLSTNKGMALKGLKDVASGGELSRVLLVLKQVLRDVSGVNVLVFDEVDTGISGSVARAVGEKLKALSAYSQVLCITHLAQVASLADHHLIVRKQQDKLATTIVQSIKGDSRVDEIARMISGHLVTKAARESARELLAAK